MGLELMALKIEDFHYAAITAKLLLLLERKCLRYSPHRPRFFREGWTLKLLVVNKSINYWANLGTTNRE